MISSPYYERQRGGNCRIHAVNMAIGARATTREEFTEVLSPLFSQVYQVPDAMPFDYVVSDGLTLAAFAAERKDDTLFALGMNHPTAETVYRQRSSRDVFRRLEGVCKACLVYNADHVWAARPGWLLDSMRGRPRKIHGPMSSCFGRHHVTLLLDRRRCWSAVRQLVASALKAHVPGNEVDFVASLWDPSASSSSRCRERSLSMLGNVYHLVAVGVRCDCRCEGGPLREAATLAESVKALHAGTGMDKEAFVKTWAPLIDRYRQEG